jgi:hypothetical protein
MTLTTYRKKPVIVEAIQVTKENWEDIGKIPSSGKWRNFAILPYGDIGVEFCQWDKYNALFYSAVLGDYLIKSSDGTWSVVSPEVFEKEYEVVE